MAAANNGGGASKSALDKRARSFARILNACIFASYTEKLQAPRGVRRGTERRRLRRNCFLGPRQRERYDYEQVERHDHRSTKGKFLTRAIDYSVNNMNIVCASLDHV